VHARNFVDLVGRILLAAIFIQSGYGKFLTLGDGSLAANIASSGLPSALAPFVVATELGGGILIAFGLLTRPVALLLAGFCLLTAALYHYDPANRGQMINFMKNVSMAGGFLVLLAHGAGGWSLDRLVFRRRGETSGEADVRRPAPLRS